MPHSAVIKAQEVISNPDYPEILKTKAQIIIDWNNKKRNDILYIWKNKSIFNEWVRLKKESTEKTQINKNRDANKKLKQKYSEEQMNAIYKAQTHLNRTCDNALLFAEFNALLQLYHFNSYDLVYQYLACSNAERKNYFLQDVAFLKWCSRSYVSEILAFKLIKLTSKHAPSI